MNENLTSNASPTEATPTAVPSATPAPSSAPTVPTAPTTPTSTIMLDTSKHGHKYWALILALMGICLAAAMYFVYKNSISNYMATTPPTTVEEKKVEPTQESTETSGSVELDKTIPTDEVTNDVLKEIDDVANTDASASFDESQVNDLQ